ncbi:hypothetical protein B4915_06570 [Leucobacter massiliensis]|uniref:Prealbumin-like fold domain-containing protein n=1 Tax=Leucobacter massiliensis TaxID=1686285 RepID=A0A2S9QPH0_9MICO|nr:hypothetical protein B4915_06570 [Leucobacter massiliensis]
MLRGRVPAVVAAVAAGALVVGVLPALSGSGLTSAADGADAAASWQPGDAAVSGPLASGTLPGVASAVEYAYGVDYAGGTEGAGAAIAGAGETVTILQGDTLTGSAAAWNTGDDASASVSVAPVSGEEISGGGASLADVLQTAPLPDTGAGAAQLRWEIPAADAAVVNTGAQPTGLAVTGPEGASAQTSVFVAQPQLEASLEVSADGGTTWAGEVAAPEGAEVVWRVTATNTGNVDLTDVKVATATANETDTLDAGVGAEIGALPVGGTGSATFTTEAGEISAGVSVSGVFDAEGPDGKPLVDRFTDAAGTAGRVPSNTAKAVLAVADETPEEGTGAPISVAPLSSAIAGGTRLTSSMNGSTENAGTGELISIKTEFFAYVPKGGSLQLDLNLALIAEDPGAGVPGTWDGLKLYVQSPSGVKTLAYQGLPATATNSTLDLGVMTFSDTNPSETGGVWRIWWQDTSVSPARDLTFGRWDNGSRTDGRGVLYFPDSTIAPRNSSGVTLTGQVWTDEISSYGLSAPNAETVLKAGQVPRWIELARSYDRTLYNLSEDGALYRNVERGFNGVTSMTRTDNYGLVGAAPADVCVRVNRSGTTNPGEPPAGNVTRWGVSGACPDFMQYKLFFQQPNTAMPASAKWFDGSTRPLLPAYVSATADVSYTQTTPVSNGTYGGNFTVSLGGDSSTRGTARLEIDVDANGTVDRTITLPNAGNTPSGTQVIPWDGLAGAATPVELSHKLRVRLVWYVPAYVYFVNSDTEARTGGITSTMLRGPASYVGSHNLIWDDSIFVGQPNYMGTALVGLTPNPTVTTGMDSSAGVHKWGEFRALPNNTPLEGNWGDNRFIQDRTDFADEAVDVLELDPPAPVIRVAKSIPNGRWDDTDQFTVSLREGSVSGATRTSVTTAGTATLAVSAPYTATAGTAYYVTEAGSGGADLANYVKRIVCVDANNVQTGLPEGVTFDPVAGLRIVPVWGSDITCTITNSVVPTGGVLQVDKKFVEADGWAVGDTLTWQVTVKNSDELKARDVVVEEIPGAGLSEDPDDVSWGTPPAPTTVDGTQWLVGDLNPGQSRTITVYTTIGAVPPPENHFRNYVTVSNPANPYDPERPLSEIVQNETVGGDTDQADFDEVPLPLGKFQVLKTGENAGGTWVPMAGSRWGLFVDDGAPPMDHSAPGVVITPVDPVGGQAPRFVVDQVPPGSYLLVELEAPAGFSLLAAPLRVTVSNTGVVSVDSGDVASGTVVFTPASGETAAQIEVRDVPAVVLPKSGGPGVWWVYGLGGVLAAAGMAGSVVSWRLRRRGTDMAGRVAMLS